MKTLMTALSLAALFFTTPVAADSSELSQRSIKSLNAIHNQLAEIREYQPHIYRGPTHRAAMAARAEQKRIEAAEKEQPWKENYQARAH